MLTTIMAFSVGLILGCMLKVYTKTTEINHSAKLLNKHNIRVSKSCITGALFIDSGKDFIWLSDGKFHPSCLNIDKDSYETFYKQKQSLCA